MYVKEKYDWVERWGANWFYCLCVFRQGLTSWLIKKEGLTPSGRGISTLTANWAVSRRAWTGKCCLMISCSIALWNIVDVWRHKRRDLPDLALFVALVQLCRLVHHHTITMCLCSTNPTTGISRNNQFCLCKLLSLQFILWWVVCLVSCKCSGGVAPVGGALLHKIACHCHEFQRQRIWLSWHPLTGTNRTKKHFSSVK